MTDSINANVVVSMPSQLFTMARSFKAVANGKIYIGKIDTDPVNPENRIQVYVENEDGSHIPVLQPIMINAAGYPVYNGQIAKFVTVQGHSMAVYDAYGAQQFYFPNVLKYDPDQLRNQLEDIDGAKKYPELQMARWRDNGDVRGFGAVEGGVVLCDESFKDAERTGIDVYVPEGRWRLSTPMILGQKGKYYGPGLLIFDNAEWWRRGGSSGSESINERYTLFYNYNDKGDVTLTYDGIPQSFTWVDDRTIEAPGSSVNVSVRINIANGYLKLGPVAEFIRSYNLCANGGGGEKLTPELPDPTTAPKGYDNTAFGPRALQDLTDGVNNTAIGSKSLMSNISGNNNTGVGFLTLYRCTGTGNTAVGSVAGEWLTTGSYNSFFGLGAGEKVKGGRYNVGVGFEAMAEAPDTIYTVAVGYRANGNPGDYSQSNSVYVGSFAGDFSIGSNNTMVGYRAGNCLGAAEAVGTGTGHDNVGIGMFAMRKNLAGNESVVIGAGAATESTITDNVVVIGYGACGETQTLGSFTVSIGHMALIAATGDNNVAVGQQALKGTTSGSSNVAIGSGSLVTNTTGALNTAIGHNSGRLTQSGESTSSLTNTTTVGNDARVSGSNQVQLGNSSTTTYVYGTVQNRSDARDKTDIRDTLLGIEFILGLRPVDGRWDMRDDYIDVIEKTRIVPKKVERDVDGITISAIENVEEKYLEVVQKTPDGSKKRQRYHHWFIAQDVLKLCEKLGVEFGGLQHHLKNGGDDVYSLGYDEFIPPIVKSIQQCWERIDNIERRIEELEMTLKKNNLNKI
ncbi:TPA: hypothetical protein JZG53_001029 [Escherichia coli]|nr:hypothetical protein [Escherichia coli]